MYLQAYFDGSPISIQICAVFVNLYVFPNAINNISISDARITLVFSGSLDIRNKILVSAWWGLSY